MSDYSQKKLLFCKQKQNKTYKRMRNLEQNGIHGKSALYGMTVMMLASLLLVSCGKKADEQAKVEPVKVKEMIVGEGGMASAGANYSGTVEEENGVALSFSTGGTIKQLRVKVGDHVRRGQLIASVDPTSVKNSFDMAHATRLQAEDAYKRMKQLHDKGSLPDIKWVEAQSQLQQAVSAENIARKSLGDCNLYAPMDGVISEKNAEVGQNAAPGMPIAKLVTTRVLNVKIAVPESEMASIRVRQRARIQVQALDGRWFNGYVIEKGVIADPITRSYSVKIRVEGATNGLLPGMVSNVSLSKVAAVSASSASSSQASSKATSSNASSADASSNIVIPASLVQLGDDNSNFVWVDEGGKAVRRTIVLGEYMSNGVSIKSGLKLGDKLIVEGQQKVCTGTALKAIVP